MTKFGELIKKTIKLSGLKYAVIADTLNFDASYISKWVTSDMIPSSRIIETVCQNYSTLLVEYTASKDRRRLFTSLDIVYTQEAEEEELKEKIYTALLNAYKEDIANRSICSQKTAPAQRSNISSEKRDALFKELTQYRSESNILRIYIIGDLYQFALDDIVFLMDLEYHILKLSFEIANINFYLTDILPTNVNIKTNIALMNLLMIGHELKTTFYTVHAQCCGLIICIEDMLLYNSQLLMNNTWKLEYINYDNKRITEFKEYIIKDLSPLNQQVFETYDISDTVTNKAKNKLFYIKELTSLTNTFNGLLISTDILEIIFVKIEDIPEEIKNRCILKQRIYEKRIENGDLVKILLFRNAYEQLIYEGIINIMGYQITVPLEIRMNILENLIDIQIYSLKSLTDT